VAAQKTGFRAGGARLNMATTILNTSRLCGVGIVVGVNEAGPAGNDFLEASGALPGAGEGG